MDLELEATRPLRGLTGLSEDQQVPVADRAHDEAVLAVRADLAGDEAVVGGEHLQPRLLALVDGRFREIGGDDGLVRRLRRPRLLGGERDAPDLRLEQRGERVAQVLHVVVDDVFAGEARRLQAVSTDLVVERAEEVVELQETPKPVVLHVEIGRQQHAADVLGHGAPGLVAREPVGDQLAFELRGQQAESQHVGVRA